MKSKFCIILSFFTLSFLFSNAQTINNIWVSPIQGPFSEFSTSFKFDYAGNIISTGFFESTVDFDPSSFTRSLTSLGDWYSDVYVCKHNNNGGLMWAKQIGGMLTDKSTDIELDENGNIYVSGMFESTADFDPSSGVNNIQSNGGKDGFILKLDSGGDLVWVKRYGGIGFDRLNDIAIRNNELYAIGDFQDTVNFDVGNSNFKLVSNGESDVYILKLNLDGDFQWVKQLEGSAYDLAGNIDIDSKGNVYGTGMFESTVDFDPSVSNYTMTAFPPPFPNQPANDIFLLKLNSNGDFQWVKQIGGYDDQTTLAFKINHKDEIILTGSIGSQSYFNLPDMVNETLNPSGQGSFFIAKYNEMGGLISEKPFGALINSISFDKDRNIYCCGNFTLTKDFNPSPTLITNMTSSTAFDINAYILKLDSNENFIFAKLIESEGATASLHIEVDAQNNIFHSGIFYGKTDFDINAGKLDITAIGYSDAFLQKLNQCFPFDSTISITTCDSFQFGDKLYKESGDYTFSSQNQFNCDSSIVLKLTINKVEPTIYSVTKATCMNGNDGHIQIVNNNNNYTYSLFPSTSNYQNNEFAQLKPMVYSLNVIDNNTHCVSMNAINLTQESCCDNPFVPTAFSPNGDNLNDELRILNVSDIDLKIFAIYNRYGNQVFLAKHPEDRWDGKYKSADSEIGTYFYFIKYVCNISKKENILKGSFELIR